MGWFSTCLDSCRRYNDDRREDHRRPKGSRQFQHNSKGRDNIESQDVRQPQYEKGEANESKVPNCYTCHYESKVIMQINGQQKTKEKHRR